MRRKSAKIAVLLSFFIPGAGLLYIDWKRYWPYFILSILFSWMIVPWILGIYYSYKLGKEWEAGRINLVTGATYKGGHKKHPIKKKGIKGSLESREEMIKFHNNALLPSNKWSIEIPIEEVFWDKVRVETGKDLDYEQKTSGMAFLATGLPVSTFSRQTTFFIIPYKDKNGVNHSPTFKVKKTEKFSKMIYNKIKENTQEKELEVSEESEKSKKAIEVLKVKLAKGKINEKEFKKKKKLLEE